MTTSHDTYLNFLLQNANKHLTIKRYPWAMVYLSDAITYIDHLLESSNQLEPPQMNQLIV